MNKSITSSKLYLISLSSIALLTIIGQFFLQGTVTQSTRDAHVTNLATRQLQLSEHLSKTALIIQLTQDSKTRTGYVEEFRHTLDLWERTHTGLQGSDASLGLSGDNSIPVTNLFADLLQRYWNMDTVAKNFLVTVDQGPFYSALPAEVSTLVSQLLVQDAAFSQGMKAIVRQYQKENSEHFYRLKQLSFLLSSLLLIVLLLEGVYLFHPTLQQLEQTSQELVATKQLVQQQVNWLQGILNNLPAFISLKDTQGRYLVVNRPFAKFLRTSAEEVKGRTDHDFFHSQLATELQAHDRKVLETNLPLGFEEVLPHSDGPHTYWSIKFPLSNGTNPYALCNIATDITASQKMEDSLQEYEAMFRICLQALPQTTLIIDPTGIVLTANQTAAQRLGVTMDKLIGANIYESLPQVIANTRRTTINEAIDTHQPIQFQEEHEGRPIDHWVYPVAPRGKSTSKLVVITYDITDQKPVPTNMSEAEKPTPTVRLPPSPPSLETTSRKVNFSLPNVEDFTETTQFRMITTEGKMLWLRDSGSFPVPAKAVSPAIHRSEAPQKVPQIKKLQRLHERVITSIYEGIVIADATQPDMPVIYINPAFERLTGYTAADVLGRNCRFLYRGEKNQPALLEIRAALAKGRNCQVILRNYRKDSSLFWNQLSLSPLYDTTGQLTHFVGIQIDITPQKQAEENLKNSEERYRRIVDTAQEGIWLLDADAKTTFVNQSLADMLGYRIAELLGHSLFEFMDAATVMTARQHFGQGQLGITEKYDFQFRRRDGSVLWTIISINPLIDEQGKFLGALGMVIDITQRKQVEAALRDSENKFRSLTERVAAAILICQGEHLVYANPAATLLTGYTPAELLQMKFWELVHPDFQTMVKEQGLARQRGENLSSRYELKILTRDNQERWLDLTAHLVEYQGEPAILATAFDITERRQAEETLRNIVEGVSARTGENFLQSLVEYLATTLQVKYALIGQLLAETPDKMMTLFVVGDHQRLLENFEYDLRNTPCEKLLTGDTPCCSYPQHVQEMFPDNPLLIKLGIDSCVGTPLFNANGKVVGLMAIMDDKPLNNSELVESMLQIFAARASAELERLQALEALQQERALLAQRVQERTAELTLANTELARATRLKHEFLANMHHELRTPLNTIITISEALQHQIYGEINSQQTEKIHTMEDSGHHLLDLINDILDLAKIEAGKLKLEILPVSIQGISNACGRLMKILADKKHITFTITIDNTMTNIQADDRYLKKILLHLLDNAVKFTPKDGAVNLTISGNQKDRIVYLTVSDTGKGIPEEQLPYLFKLFEQLDGRLAREHGGAGLGLFLVYRLVEMHGGYVTVASEVGKGSCFTVAVPWQPEEVKEIDATKDHS